MQTRRQMLATSGCLLTANAVMNKATAHTISDNVREPFGYCLNTSTISGQKLGIVQIVDITAKAGYRSIEPWIREFDEYVKQGGVLRDLAKRFSDAGLTIESAIGFPSWIVDDDTRRAQGLEEAKRNMDLVAQLGGKRLAAPPAGATDVSNLNLYKAAERYRALLELGDRMGVVPQVEVWGFSQSVSRLSEAYFIAIESGHPRACVLADVYHLYKGGSSFDSLRLVQGNVMHVLHMNDYPADPPREQITDAHRVYPGDGVAPLDTFLQTLRDIGYRGVLSLEVFNREYWKRDAQEVARTGLEKMRAAVQRALS
jgi:sugar phosphate isomerase/epimerase